MDDTEASQIDALLAALAEGPSVGHLMAALADMSLDSPAG